MKVGLKGGYIARTCFPDVEVLFAFKNTMFLHKHNDKPNEKTFYKIWDQLYMKKKSEDLN